MDVFLLQLTGKRRPAFHAEHPDDTTPRDEQGRPIRGRLERWWRRLLARTKYAVRRGGPGAHKVWKWLNRQPPPDEPLLNGLRHAREVVVFHPATMRDDEAQHLWSRYLARRWRSHLITLAWDLAISPLIALLMFVPGPNIIGYWFTYRILTHLLAMRGVMYARLDWTACRFQPEPALNDRISPRDAEQIAQLSKRLRLDDLDEFLKRLATHFRGRMGRFGQKRPGHRPDSDGLKSPADSGGPDGNDVREGVF